MKQAALLAVLRNMVCHGSLLPSKAKSWGLEGVYEDGIEIVSMGIVVMFQDLMRETRFEKERISL
jgi:hypothetical protein